MYPRRQLGRRVFGLDWSSLFGPVALKGKTGM